MKILCIVSLLLIGTNVHAASLTDKVSFFQSLFGHPTSSTQISKTSYNQLDTRPKAILKGVFYIGGSNKKRSLLTSDYLQKVCSDSFSRVYSVYRKVDQTVSCSNNSYNYQYIGEARTGGGGKRVYNLLRYLYEQVINGDEGAVFLHCHYGVHASNTIAQMVQMQFCGLSKENAKRNWDVIDLYDSLGAEGRQRQFEKIDGFTPYSDFQINSEQKAKICY